MLFLGISGQNLMFERISCLHMNILVFFFGLLWCRNNYKQSLSAENRWTWSFIRRLCCSTNFFCSLYKSPCVYCRYNSHFKSRSKTQWVRFTSRLELETLRCLWYARFQCQLSGLLQFPAGANGSFFNVIYFTEATAK